MVRTAWGMVVFVSPLPTAQFSLIEDLDEQYFPHISHMWWTGSATSSNSTKLLLISLYKILITENILIDFNLCNKSFSNFIFINIYIFINFWSKEIFTESKIYIFKREYLLKLKKRNSCPSLCHRIFAPPPHSTPHKILGQILYIL